MDQLPFLVAALAITFVGLLVYWAYLRSRLSALRRSASDRRQERGQSSG